MGILNRFLLFLFTLVSLAAAGGLVAVATRLVPERMWLAVVNAYAGRPETLAGLAIYLVVGLVLLIAALTPSKSGERHGELTLASDAAGRIQVATAAVKDVAERAARSVHGVRDVRTKLTVARPKNAADESTVRLAMQLVLGTEVPVKDVADEVHGAVQQELAALLGLDHVELAIAVSEITQAKLPHQPRVS